MSRESEARDRIRKLLNEQHQLRGRMFRAARHNREVVALETARKLLVEWEKYARTLADANVTPLPQSLYGRTVGFLDSTAV